MGSTGDGGRGVGECRKHGITAVVREADGVLIDK
jgi:hypothetical protein